MKNRLLISLSFILFSLFTFSQNYIGIYGEPSFQFTRLTGKPDYEVDSLNSIKEINKNIGFGIEFTHFTDRFNSISGVVTYNQFSTQFVKRNMQFLDVIHPGLPEIRDLSQASEKIAYIQDRFQFIGLQFMYKRSVSSRLKSAGVLFDMHAGLNYHYLLGQDVKVTTEGFAIDEKFVHIINSDFYFDASKHNISLSAGASAMYNITPSWQVYAQGILRSPILNMAQGESKLIINSTALRLGIRRLL